MCTSIISIKKHPNIFQFNSIPIEQKRNANHKKNRHHRAINGEDDEKSHANCVCIREDQIQPKKDSFNRFVTTHASSCRNEESEQNNIVGRQGYKVRGVCFSDAFAMCIGWPALFLSVLLCLSGLVDFDWFSIVIPFKFLRCYFLVTMMTKRSHTVWDFSTLLHFIIDWNESSNEEIQEELENTERLRFQQQEPQQTHGNYCSYSFSLFLSVLLVNVKSVKSSHALFFWLIANCNDNFLLLNLLQFFFYRKFPFFTIFFIKKPHVVCSASYFPLCHLLKHWLGNLNSTTEIKIVH